MEKDTLINNTIEISSDSSSIVSDDSLEQPTGPDFADFAKQLTYEKGNNHEKSDVITSNNYFHPYENLPLVKSEDTSYIFPSTFLNVDKLPKTTDLTTLFLIDSVNRDKNVFPQPTTFTLRLPRVYKNIKSIQITQLKLLCSFYYFSKIKSNIYLPIIENDRTTTLDINGNTTNIATINNTPITKLISIREGTYSITELLKEIQIQMNYTPLFYDFPNGFTDFINLFRVSGDYSVNFNQPGDTYYDSVNNKYITNPTLNLINSYYWGTRYAGLSDYSINQLKVAYYYPVFYEVFLDDNDTTARPFLNLNVPHGLLGTNETVYTHILFNMSGINDPIATHIINQNLNLLDNYRLNHTFRYSLINRYELSYDPQSLQISFTTVTLNTSLVNLINNTANSAMANILANKNLTTASYTALQESISISRVVYADMFQFIQNQLVKLLGIPYATYSQQFFNNLSNIIYIQNGSKAIGVRSSYTKEYLQSNNLAIDSSGLNSPAQNKYWPNFKSIDGYPVLDISMINSENSLIPYNIYSKNFNLSTFSMNK
jgi:hypothetical protein